MKIPVFEKDVFELSDKSNRNQIVKYQNLGFPNYKYD